MNYIRKLVTVRTIYQAVPVRENNLLRKTVRKYYAVKGMILVQQWANRFDVTEFVNIGLQVQDKVNNFSFFINMSHYLLIMSHHLHYTCICPNAIQCVFNAFLTLAC